MALDDSVAKTRPKELEELYLNAKREHDWTLDWSRKLSHFNTALNVTTIVLAAAAGVTVLPESINRWYTAILAFAAAIASGLALSLRPDAAWREFRRRSIDWLRLANDARALNRSLEQLPPEDAERRLADLRKRQYEISKH